MYPCSYRKLGENWKIEDSVLDEIETFTGAMYGYPREMQVNCVRSKMLKKIVGEKKPLRIASKVDLIRLPPCRDFLLPHVQRVNYREFCYKKLIPPFLNDQSHMTKINGGYMGKQIS